MAAPLVDVGVPTHGRPAFVTEALDSVLAQPFGDWRLRVSEDGPGEGAVREAVEPYLRDERVSYEATGERVGAAGNMTRLVQAGDAPYVIVLHDDDIWEPGMLERRVRFLESHPGCGFVFGGHFDIDADGRRTGYGEFPLAEGVHPPATLAPMMLRRNVVSIVSGVLVRREAYERVGPAFDETYPRIFDWEMWARLAMEFDAGFVATRDVGYRRHARQISGVAGRASEFLALYEHLERLLARAHPALRPGERERERRRSRLLLASALDAAEEGDRRGARVALRRALSLDRRAALHPNFAATLAAVVGGRPGRSFVGAARRARYRRSDRPDRPEGGR
jgi:glycosyltransferase involved in cell wall biosynthesis